ncbi:Endonuclease/exonuclease/phosphatase [Acrodontium crateriforme]|uniref:Endonuclease/exonuclease/phosphatase n=1 Tax=Acrodontium crateriforme TaxID=150365 RepID=A0AAQ3LXB6_9PEZI|nr:Endonuclease/exonuclease/phosphatase [Acrodontium crateriforme]
MESRIQRSIQLVESKNKTSIPWPLDAPYRQPYFKTSSDGKKTGMTPVTSAEAPAHDAGITKLAIYSWNIDFMLPHASSRMRAGIRHLEHLMGKYGSEVANVIFLAECVDTDLELISFDPWIQSNFAITDVNNDNWANGHYGTTTLIDRRLSINDVFRVHYSKTRMQRDGLFVDIHFGPEAKLIRLCNTHLESMAFEPAYRPPQMQLCATFMHDTGVHGSILAGDLNAIQDFDKHLHSDNDLKDAYLEQGGIEDDAQSGHTWGQQAATFLREKFGTSRMDKVYFCGAVQLKSFERFGANVILEDENERAEVVQLGFDQGWITDHFGVKAVFEL